LSEDLAGFGKAAAVVLAPDLLAIGHDVEDAAGPFLESGGNPDLLLDRIRQTGGIGVIVSLPAVGDGDVHAVRSF
jgi:hypothetical protein